jgi:mRNA interferase RelE/StbE
MSEWSVGFERSAERDLEKIEQKTRRRIIEKLYWLAQNFDVTFPQTLEGEWGDFYKLRVGDWRVKYKINRKEMVIIVVYIDWRDKAYRKKR